MTKDWVNETGHSPVCQSFAPASTSSAGMLSTPADFPFSVIVLRPPLFYEGWGGRPLCLGTVQYCWISLSLVIVQLRVVFCPSVPYLSFFCQPFSWTILNSSSFPLFHSSQVFHDLVCSLTVSSYFLQSNYTVLLSSFLLPFSRTSGCCCSLPCISQFLYVRQFSFSVLSFCHIHQEFPQWPSFFFFFFLTMFAKDLTCCFWTHAQQSLSNILKASSTPTWYFWPKRLYTNFQSIISLCVCGGGGEGMGMQ